MEEHKIIEQEAAEEVVLKEEAQENSLGKSKGFFKDNRGVGVIEIVLILVIIFTIYMGCK